jgi:hypothetical protein
MTNYAPQVWEDDDPTRPLSAQRMQHIEDGLTAVDQAAINAAAAAIVAAATDATSKAQTAQGAAISAAAADATSKASAAQTAAVSAAATDATSKVAAEATARNAAITAAVNGLVNGAPAALDTLKELADAVSDDASFAATVTTALGARLRFDAAQTLTSGQQTQAQANLGLPALLAALLGNYAAARQPRLHGHSDGQRVPDRVWRFGIRRRDGGLRWPSAQAPGRGSAGCWRRSPLRRPSSARASCSSMRPAACTAATAPP